MNKPKLLISVLGGVVHIHGATEDMQIYLVDWDNEACHEELWPDTPFNEMVLKEWFHPTEIIESDFEKYVENYFVSNKD